MTTRVVVAGAALSILFSCSATPAKTCMADSDCATGLKCENAACVTPQVSTECSAGQSRPCGPEPVGACRKGIQICVDGVFESDCRFAVNPAAEQCNSIDDDCDGVVDNGVMQTFYPDVDGDGFGSSAAGASQLACARPAGFVTSNTDCDDSAASINPSATERCDAAGVDEDCDGTVNEGCACSNPGMSQACCAGRGTQTCDVINGGTMLSVCSVMPSRETCNAIDDDCNGQVDDQYALVSTDGGVLLIAGGVLELDGGCVVGLGACARSGSSTCANGVLGCSVAPGDAGAETCNGLDDDCDGQTDNAANLCSVTGQSCTNGACACASGEAVCGTSCQALGGSCSAGVGSCRRQGAMACINSTVACDAVAGTPVAEVCDGADNDCDGTVDNGVTITCLADGDGDRYAPSSTSSQQCPDGTRTAFGNCPAGFVAPSAALAGNDCDDNDATRWGLADVRTDADSDSYCVGATMSSCIGAFPPTGLRAAGSCNAAVDCDDANASAYQLISTRPDADGDSYCLGAAANTCVGASAPSGRRFTVSCAAADDCDDSNASTYQLVSTRADADGDSYCLGAAASSCVGNSAPSGRRFSASCSATDDCNDTDAARWQLVAARTDADNDSYCVGFTANVCAGSALPVGLRAPINCQATDDCNDNSASVYRLVSSRSDADNDGYCVGSSANDCAGATALAGRRFAASCAATDDCVDTDATRYRVLSVRADADGDTWCTGLVINQCTGAAPQPGFRVSSSCAGDDCSDSNPYANSTCFIAGGYATSFHTQTCPNGTTDYSVNATQICPVGFSLGNLQAVKTAGQGACSAVNATSVRQTCNFLEGSTCGVVGDCFAQ